MGSLLRWIAASVALVVGLALGTGTANAGTPSSAKNGHSVAESMRPTGGMQAQDWWW